MFRIPAQRSASDEPSRRDVQFSPIAILDDAAAEVERISYTPYGVARHHPEADVTGDGAVGNPDLQAVLSNWGSFGTGDINRDGTAALSDYLAVTGQWGQEEPAGDISFAAEDNIIGYDGYIFDEEVQHYHVRHRTYLPELGRWTQRDPLGYVDGMSLYGYYAGERLSVDPFGLQDSAPGFIPGRGLSPLRINDSNPMLFDEPYHYRPENKPVDDPTSIATIAMLETFLAILDAGGCFAQCFVLDLTDEDIERILKDIYGQLPPKAMEWFTMNFIAAGGGFNALPPVILANLIRVLLGEGALGGGVDSVLRNLRPHMREKMLMPIRRAIQKALGKAGLKGAIRAIGNASFVLSLFTLAWTGVEALQCACACEDGRFTDSDRVKGGPLPVEPVERHNQYKYYGIQSANCDCSGGTPRYH